MHTSHSAGLVPQRVRAILTHDITRLHILHLRLGMQQVLIDSGCLLLPTGHGMNKHFKDSVRTWSGPMQKAAHEIALNLAYVQIFSYLRLFYSLPYLL